MHSLTNSESNRSFKHGPESMVRNGTPALQVCQGRSQGRLPVARAPRRYCAGLDCDDFFRCVGRLAHQSSVVVIGEILHRNRDSHGFHTTVVVPPLQPMSIRRPRRIADRAALVPV